MYRVLHVTQPTHAGVAQVVADLVTDQLNAGWDVFTACPPSGPLATMVTSAGAEVLPWPATRGVGLSAVAETWRLRSLVTQIAPDLVHLHSAKAGLAGRLAIRGRRPTVFQPHAWSFEAVTGTTHRLSLAWERHAARWTHRLVCVSEHERDRGRWAGVAAAASVVPNGVDVTWFRDADGADRARARSLLGLPDAPTVVCVGRLCRQKGQDVLLTAWPDVTAAVAGARLALVGDGPDRERLTAAAPPGVHFAGHVDDPRLWYASADVVAIPSRWEGSALVLLEAMASARCVVATDVGGARESLPSGETAIVPVADVPALARALTVRLSCPDMAEAEGAASRAYVVAHHDIAWAVESVRAVYADLFVTSVSS